MKKKNKMNKKKPILILCFLIIMLLGLTLWTVRGIYFYKNHLNESILTSFVSIFSAKKFQFTNKEINLSCIYKNQEFIEEHGLNEYENTTPKTMVFGLPTNYNQDKVKEYTAQTLCEYYLISLTCSFPPIVLYPGDYLKVELPHGSILFDGKIETLRNVSLEKADLTLYKKCLNSPGDVEIYYLKNETMIVKYI